MSIYIVTKTILIALVTLKYIWVFTYFRFLSGMTINLGLEILTNKIEITLNAFFKFTQT